MSIKGPDYPYLGSGRELFKDGSHRNWYVAKTYHVAFTFLDLSGTDATPLVEWTKDLTVQFDLYRVFMHELSFTTVWPPSAASSTWTVEFIRDGETGEQTLDVTMASLVPDPFGPGISFWDIRTSVPFDPDWYKTLFNLFPATLRVNGIIIPGNWICNFTMNAIGW